MKRYILTIDEGTTSVRTVLFDTVKKEIVKLERAKLNIINPKDMWVELDANDILTKTKSCLCRTLKGIRQDEIYGLGIANQRETIVAWNKAGKPLYNAIVWQCRRTAKQCDKLAKLPIAKVIYNKTGLIVNSYFSATKIQWLLNNVKAVKEAYKNNDLCIGTIETFLTYCLSKGKYFVTDVTNASRTMLFNIATLKWDEELLKFFKVDKKILANKIVDNDEIIGTIKIDNKNILLAGLFGDQQSSLFGQTCFNKGDIKTTYGTGCFMLVNIGAKLIKSKHNLLTTIANRVNKKTYYAFEGSVFNAGSLIEWAIKNKVGSSPKNIMEKAMQGKSKDIYFIPAFNGIGAPYWNMSKSEKLFGANIKTINKNDLCKVLHESIALRNNDVYSAMKKDLKVKHTMFVDGGLSKDFYLMQLQANILNTKIQIKNLESTALGTVFATGLATKAFKDLKSIKKILLPQMEFVPIRDNNTKKLINGWIVTMKKYLEE